MRGKGEKKEEKVEVSLEERLDAIAYAAFGDLGAKLARAFEFERVLAEAGMSVHPAVYGARIIFLVYIAVIIVLASIIPIIYLPISPMFKLVLGLALGMVPVYVFLAGLMYPQSRASERSRQVDYELPFAATYMTTLARGGVSIGRILERMAESRVFHAMREEARRILREVRFFGKDILSAIEYVASRHPNRFFKDFMLGWVSVIRTGGDIVHYLEAKTSALFEARINAIRVIAERVAAFAEAYIIFSVIGSIGFYVFFAAGSLLGIGAGGAQALISFILFAFIVLPLVSIATIVVIGKMLPPAGIELEKSKKVALASIPVAAAIFFMLMIVTGTLGKILTGHYDKRVFMITLVAMLATLEAIAIPSSIAFISETRGARGLEFSLASFLRDLAEVRKTGLSPERSLIYVARRDYGKFTWIVRQIASRVAWGFPLRKSAEKVLRRVKDWFTVMIMTFLIDAIDVGGGSPITLDTLARFTSVLAELEVDLKRRTRAYVFMPYFGAILTAVATIMVLKFSVQTLSVAPTSGFSFGPRGGLSKTQLWQAATVFSIAVLLNSFLMGMVAGKIATRFTEGGFLHAALLTAIVAAIVLALMGVSL